MLEVAQS